MLTLIGSLTAVNPCMKVLGSSNFVMDEPLTRLYRVLVGVTESYVSTLVSGRRSTNLSTSIANLIDEKLGYNAQWVLAGDEPKYKQLSKSPDISDIHRRVIVQIEKMSDSEARAVLAFVDTLNSINKEKQGND